MYKLFIASDQDVSSPKTGGRVRPEDLTQKVHPVDQSFGRILKRAKNPNRQISVIPRICHLQSIDI